MSGGAQHFVSVANHILYYITYILYYLTWKSNKSHPGFAALYGASAFSVNQALMQNNTKFKNKKVFMGNVLRCVIKHWPTVIDCNPINFFLFLFSEQEMMDAEVRYGSNGPRAAMKRWHEGLWRGPLQLFPGGDGQGAEPMIILIPYFIHFDWRVFSFSNSYHEVPHPSLHCERSISISNLLTVSNSTTRPPRVKRPVLFFRAV